MEVKMDVGSDGVAVIFVSNPPVNAFAVSIIGWLKEKIAEAMGRDDVKAIVLTGMNGKFSGGFDINVFQKVQQTGNLSLLPDLSIDLVVNRIEDAKKPIVVAIEGLALGAGLEVLMGCHARIAAPKAQLGLPELSLGIIPGAGGTQRLPRLVGLPKAIDMMLTSKSILSEEGKKLGLIDAIVPPQKLLEVSRQWALDIAEKQKPWVRSLHKTDKIGSLPEVFQIITVARQQVKRASPNTPQHQACLDVIQEGIVHGGYHGVLKEGKVFNELVVSDTSKGLCHVFFSQRATSKVPNVTDIGLKPRPVKKVAVIGGGLMGSGIATALIISNINVVFKEVDSEYLTKGLKMIEANVGDLVARKKLAQSAADKALSKIKGVLDYLEFKDVDMVIEAVIENVQLKQEIFSEIENVCPPHCILATNTSTIDLNLVGGKVTSKDRVVGAHFFSPAHMMPLLEIIRTEKTSAQVILDLMTVGKIIKKVPVVVGNCTGFAVSRIVFSYEQSAHILLHLGFDLFTIDKLITSFGLPVGPFQLEDLAGYGVAKAVAKEFASAYPDRAFKSPVVDLLIKNGRNGKNNGKGYYIYEKGSKPKPDPMVLPIIEESRRLAKLVPRGQPVSVTDQEIVEMVLFPVVNEACRVLEEQIVVRASDLDIASVLGMSFPSYRGGIIFWADLVGSKHIYTSLKKWSEKYGNFYKPSRFLEERAMNGVPLSAPVTSPTGSRARL
ncbi:peroxisomal fatty acid beta-oxidation multifunctional protein AIM1-like [Bidens hawaiensis]|uniref:peroxisomal fatty acid beta-oxidation multifunctional protein AIM1-like n=1 Tax=Bidens hawaiensis TaxID=980011 RepID=UPI004049F075